MKKKTIDAVKKWSASEMQRHKFHGYRKKFVLSLHTRDIVCTFKERHKFQVGKKKLFSHNATKMFKINLWYFGIDFDGVFL